MDSVSGCRLQALSEVNVPRKLCFPEAIPGSETMALFPPGSHWKMSFACGLLGKCHSLSLEQLGPVRVMYHWETVVGARPVSMSSCPGGVLQPCLVNCRGPRGVLSSSVYWSFWISEKATKGQALLASMPGEKFLLRMGSFSSI